MIDIHATHNRSEADVQLVGEYGMRFFRPLSELARQWFDDNLYGENSYLHGELIVESRYADDLIEGLTEDGMTFFVPQWMDEEVDMCESCHEVLGADSGITELLCESTTPCSVPVCSNCAHVCDICGHTGCPIHANNHPCPQD